MNKLKEIQKAAGIQVVRTLMREDENTEVKLMLTETQLEKFALLVAQACANVCKEHKEMYASLAASDVTFAAMTTAASVCATEIEKHFGVE